MATKSRSTSKARAAAEAQTAVETPIPAAPAIPAPRPSDGAFLDHVKKMNDVFYDQIRIADQKAAYIFTFMVAFLISSAEGRGVFRLQRYQTDDFVIILLSALLAAAVIFSLVSAILVVLPRHRAASSSLYWGGWPSHRQTFLDAREKGDTAYVFEQYIGNVDNLSAINRSKYRFVGFAFRGLLVTVVAYVLLLGYGTGATAMAS